MRNAIAMLPVAFAIYPMITGPIAPPTFVMMSREEASLVFVPVFLNAKENMVVNMMLSSRCRVKVSFIPLSPAQSHFLHSHPLHEASLLQYRQGHCTHSLSYPASYLYHLDSRKRIGIEQFRSATENHNCCCSHDVEFETSRQDSEHTYPILSSMQNQT